MNFGRLKQSQAQKSKDINNLLKDKKVKENQAKMKALMEDIDNVVRNHQIPLIAVIEVFGQLSEAYQRYALLNSTLQRAPGEHPIDGPKEQKTS